jgi:dolichyl-phosphate beta-glucosyltransferase
MATPESHPTLSIVLPAYRSADVLPVRVPPLLDYLDGLGIDHEVVIVDDGSEDGGGTKAAAESLGCLYLKNDRNRGKGYTVRRGMTAARGRFRVFTDADIPYELQTIGLVLHHLDTGGYPVVAGDRTLPSSSPAAPVPTARALASRLYAGLVGRLVGPAMTDTQCGLKGFHDRIADELFSVSRIDGFAFDVELLAIARRRDYPVKRIPVRLCSNETSTVRLLAHGPAMLRDLLAIRWNLARGVYDRA